MTCCHVRVAPAGSPAFQYTRRKVAGECGSFFVLVAGGDHAIGFVLVAGLEGFLFLGGEVFAVVNSPRTEEHNNVQPGPIDTELNPATGDWAVPQKAATALNRYGKVDDIAAMVAFVAGPEASYITGANLTVDVGMNA